MTINKKITSTFLAVMILSVTALTVIPIPQAHASSNANLYVSAENSQWNNYFAGPQVIEVIVSDPDINRLDIQYGEPVVTVNGKRLHMAQATDGNWYGYFADSKQAQIADSTQGNTGKGLDFGRFCSALSAINATGVTFPDTKGIAISESAPGSINGVQNPSAAISAMCTGATDGALSSIVTSSSLLNHVVRQNKTLNPGGLGGVTMAGQISANNAAMEKAWPIIQLYDFSAIPTTVTVDYQKSGGDQITTLTFDKIPQNLISANLDKSSYTPSSQVLVTMNDPQLNIDPTERDSWTWGTSTTNNTVYYQEFDRFGNPDADGTSGMQNILGNLSTFMFNHNGRLTVNPMTSGPRVVGFTINDLQTLDSSGGTRSVKGVDGPMTFVENGQDTGIFKNSDGVNISDLSVLPDDPLHLIRGHFATLRYNDLNSSIVVNSGSPTAKQIMLANLVQAKSLVNQDRYMDAADKLLDTSLIVQGSVVDPEKTKLLAMINNAIYSDMISATPGGIHDYPLQCQSHEVEATVTPVPVGQIAFTYSNRTGPYSPNITINKTEDSRCLPYLIRGNSVLSAAFDETAHTLTINLQPNGIPLRNSGQFIILSIDRSLLDFKDNNGNDLAFTSLVDGVQSNHQENNTALIRILEVPFQFNSSKIVISSTLPYHASSRPTNVVSQALLQNGTLFLSWKTPQDNGGTPITQYVIERKSIDENSWHKIASSNGDITTYMDAKVSPGVTYLYRISAINKIGSSLPAIVGAEISKASTTISGTSADGSTLVLINSEPRIPVADKPLKINISFYDENGKIVKGKHYTLAAFQDGKPVITTTSKDTDKETGKDSVDTTSLPTNSPVDVQVSFNDCPPNTPPQCNDNTVTATVPEFGQIAMLILLISFTSIALMSYRFKLNL